MIRFLLGFLFGALLTIHSLGIAGVGHGTYAPFAFAAGLFVVIPGLDAVAVPMGPISWALYFGLIPKLRRRSARIACAAAVATVHVLTFGWVAREDPVFRNTLHDQRSAILGFAALAQSRLLRFFCFRQGETSGPKTQQLRDTQSTLAIV